VEQRLEQAFHNGLVCLDVLAFHGKVDKLAQLSRGIADSAGKAPKNIPHWHHANVHHGSMHVRDEPLYDRLTRQDALNKIVSIRSLAARGRQMRQRILSDNHFTNEICQTINPRRIDTQRP
jgi:hypothetical protein